MNTPTIINEVKRRWLIGESVHGGIIGEYASEDYRQYKMYLNPKAGGRVDLMLTGSLAEHMTIRKSGNEFEIFSTDEKFMKIGRKYGFEEFGLNDEQLHELFSDIYSFALETMLNNAWE